MHVAAACDQMPQLCSNIRQAQKEQKLNYGTKNPVLSKEFGDRSRTIEDNPNGSRPMPIIWSIQKLYYLENTLKNMYEKEMKRKRRNEYMKKYMAQKRQYEK